MNPVIVETEINATADVIWAAITDKNQIKEWSFDLSGFQAEPGNEFRFWGGTENRKWLHICVVKDVLKYQRLSYSWRYEGIPGETVVTYKIEQAGSNSRIKLVHEGLENFPADIPELARENFENGWNGIIKNLKCYIEKL